MIADLFEYAFNSARNDNLYLVSPFGCAQGLEQASEFFLDFGSKVGHNLFVISGISNIEHAGTDSMD